MQKFREDEKNQNLMSICHIYRKVPKFSDARKLCCNQPKILSKKSNYRVICPKDANGMANSLKDPDQTAPPLGAV